MRNKHPKLEEKNNSLRGGSLPISTSYLFLIESLEAFLYKFLPDFTFKKNHRCGSDKVAHYPITILSLGTHLPLGNDQVALVNSQADNASA